MKQQIILASQSQSRQMALSFLQVPFTAIPSSIDEKSIRDADLSLRAEKIARAKAEVIATIHQGIIISGDTFVMCNEKILEKPSTQEEAKEMLTLLSGRKAHVYTGFCYIDKVHHINTSKAVIVACMFRTFAMEEINAYASLFPVTSWAGGFSTAHPYGTSLVAEIHGSYTGFTYGLPLEIVIPLLRESGYLIVPKKKD